MKSSRRSFLAWTLTAAAAIPLGLALFSARRFVFQQPDSAVPAKEPDTFLIIETVAISSDQDDKLYHLAGCSHLRDKTEIHLFRESSSRGIQSLQVLHRKSWEITAVYPAHANFERLFWLDSSVNGLAAGDVPRE
jgi:hypothetical protein